MSIETDVDPSGGFARHVGIGPLDRAAFLDALRKIYAHPDYDAKRGGIWDLRGADVTALTASDMQDIVAFIRETQGPQPGRTAIVVSREVEFGLGRMYEAYSESIVDFRVFRDPNLAQAWVLEASKPDPESP